MTMQRCLSVTVLSLAVLAGPLWAASTDKTTQEQAESILEASGVGGGLIVHLYCGNGQLTTALGVGHGRLVHGLTRRSTDLAEARKTIDRKRLHGAVSVDLITEKTLPYVDNSVNLIVAEGPVEVSEKEMMRVLAPRGVVYRRAGDSWTKTIKPWPDNIDEWTHYMHDPGNNAVAHDTAVGPPRHLQWDGAPRYSRHHEYTSSVAAMVSARGRLFSIIDMGSRASIHMPAQWRLIARDAFNGIVLWERPIESWFNHLWPLKDGPAQPPRRLVAIDDCVYVTLSLEAPVSKLNAATGRTLHTYQDTEFTEEILHCGDTLLLLKNDASMNPADYYPKLMVCWDEKNRTMKEANGYLLKPTPREIIALDPETGAMKWKASHAVEPLTLAADETSVFFHNWNQIVCLDRKTGDEKWRSKPVVPRKTMGYVYGPTLVAYDDVVLFADGRLKRKIWAFSKDKGELLWEAPHYPAGHAGSAEDLLVTDGLVWCGKIAGGKHSGVFTGRDPSTGQVKREFLPDVETYWFHHRCYRAKATDKYILASRTGIELIDVRAQSWEPHHWVRGACTYGILPCNGLIYAPPHPCACYSESKLSGLCALAPASQRALGDVTPVGKRLERGPAYGTSLQPAADGADQWLTYRHDAARSGVTKTRIDATLAPKWRVPVGGELTAPVVADGQVYVASQETNTLYALSAANGAEVWTFTAGARLDSPPTLYRGRAFFGSADGHVYCLRASDGALVWRFRAAPRDRRIVSYGRLESVWPVSGSLLVHKDVVYGVAGRSTYLDGGLRLFSLDAATGKLLAERVLYDQQNPQKDVTILNMPTAQADILSTDGEMLYMRSQAFDLSGQRVQTIDPATEPFERATQQIGFGAHLFSPTGFLDSDAWHRSYWVHGRAFSSGCNWWYRAGRYAPAGRLLVVDGDRVYGFGRQPGLFVWSHVLENHLFCSAAQAEEEAIERVKQWSQKAGRDGIFNRRFTRHAMPTDHRAPQLHWSAPQPPLHARAMILAGPTLLVAGPPDVLNEDEAYERPSDPQVRAQIVEQNAAYEGRRGALLVGISADTGRQRFRIDLPAAPTWDGLAAAEGEVFLSDRDGALTCLTKEVAVGRR